MAEQNESKKGWVEAIAMAVLIPLAGFLFVVLSMAGAHLMMPAPGFPVFKELDKQGQIEWHIKVDGERYWTLKSQCKCTK